jgi:hypothetical protein
MTLLWEILQTWQLISPAPSNHSLSQVCWLILISTYLFICNELWCECECDVNFLKKLLFCMPHFWNHSVSHKFHIIIIRSHRKTRTKIYKYTGLKPTVWKIRFDFIQFCSRVENDNVTPILRRLEFNREPGV